MGNAYLQTTGSYQNKSKYVRVKSINAATPSYLNQFGVAQNQYTGSIPAVGSGSYNGSFGAATGAIYGSFGKEAVNFFENIPNVASTIGTQNSIKKYQNAFAPGYQGVYQFNSLTDFYNSVNNGTANAKSYYLQYSALPNGDFPWRMLVRLS